MCLFAFASCNYKADIAVDQNKVYARRNDFPMDTANGTPHASPKQKVLQKMERISHQNSIDAYFHKRMNYVINDETPSRVSASSSNSKDGAETSLVRVPVIGIFPRWWWRGRWWDTWWWRWRWWHSGGSHTTSS